VTAFGQKLSSTAKKPIFPNTVKPNSFLKRMIFENNDKIMEKKKIQLFFSISKFEAETIFPTKKIIFLQPTFQ